LYLLSWVQIPVIKAQTGQLKFFGDTRIRLEFDRDAQKPNGEWYPDRDRLRFRFRFGIKYYYNNFEMGGRIRTGNAENPQSSNITFGDKFQTDHINLDKAYIKYNYKGFNIWIGKNQMNMWMPDDMLWDTDVNPEGIALHQKFWVRNQNFNFNAGFFLLSHNKTEQNKQTFDRQANIGFVQLKWSLQRYRHKLIIAPAMMWAHTTPVFSPDYKIFSNYIKYRYGSFQFHFDYFINFENLKHKVLSAYENEKNAYVFAVQYSYKKSPALSIGYAHIEKYAIIDRFAQDNWVRWSGTNYTRSSNFKGWEIGLKHKISKNIETQIKYWTVKGLQKTDWQKTFETGKRLRWDMKIKF